MEDGGAAGQPIVHVQEVTQRHDEHLDTTQHLDNNKYLCVLYYLNDQQLFIFEDSFYIWIKTLNYASRVKNNSVCYHTAICRQDCELSCPAKDDLSHCHLAITKIPLIIQIRRFPSVSKQCWTVSSAASVSYLRQQGPAPALAPVLGSGSGSLHKVAFKVCFLQF